MSRLCPCRMSSRLNPTSYQRLYFRNANHPISRPSVTARRHDRPSTSESLRTQEKDAERRLVKPSIIITHCFNARCRNSHIFDGQILTKETAAFQLCDIVDPMLKEMIEDPGGLRESCNVSSYFFIPVAG